LNGDQSVSQNGEAGRETAPSIAPQELIKPSVLYALCVPLEFNTQWFVRTNWNSGVGGRGSPPRPAANKIRASLFWRLLLV